MTIEEIISADEAERGIKPKRFCIYRNGEYVTFKIIDSELCIEKDLHKSQAMKILTAWIDGAESITISESPILHMLLPATGRSYGDIGLSTDNATRTFPLTGYGATLLFRWLQKLVDQIIERDFQ